MASFFLSDNRMAQERLKDKLAFDLHIPFHAGRQTVRRTEKFTGGFNGERPSNLINLRHWINAQIESGYIVAGNFRYKLANNLNVLASTTEVTATVSPGTITLNMPRYTDLFKLDFIGTTSDLDNNDELIVDLIYDTNFQFNNDLNDMILPFINIWDLTAPDTNNDEITENYAAIDLSTQEPPTKTIISVGNNRLTIKITNLQLFTKWGLSIRF